MTRTTTPATVPALTSGRNAPPSAGIFERLMADAKTSGRRNNLNRLKSACDAIASKGEPLTLTNIEREIETTTKARGPTAGTIANSNNKRKDGTIPANSMRSYVAARVAEEEAAAAKRGDPPRRRGTVLTSLLDSVSDVDSRAALFALHDRCVRAEDALARAEVALATLRPGLDITALLDGRNQPDSAPTGQTVPPSLIANLDCVVSTLTNAKLLAGFGLMREENGRIRMARGLESVLLNPKDVSGIETLLAVLHDGQAAAPRRSGSAIPLQPPD